MSSRETNRTGRPSLGDVKTSAYQDEVQDLMDYYAYCATSSNFTSSLTSISIVCILLLLRGYLSDSEVSRVVELSRIAALLGILAYFGTLHRVQKRKKVYVSLRFCGDFVIFQRVIVGGVWIYHTMKNSDEILFDAVLEFVISVGAHIIFSVHSTWSAAIVWMTHSAVIVYSTVGSGPVQYLHVFMLCLIVAIVSFMAESHQFDSYKSYVEKHNLMMQLARKTEEMRALIGNVAHDLKVRFRGYWSRSYFLQIQTCL